MNDPTLLNWVEKGQNIAALLVAVGVAAEFVLGFIAGPARHRVERAHEKEVAALSQKAEELRLQNTQLQEAIQPRALSVEQQKQIGDALLPFQGRRLRIISGSADAEEWNFATQIASALKSGQLAISDERGTRRGEGSGPPPVGIWITWPPGQKDLAMALAEALDKIGHVKELQVLSENTADKSKELPVIIQVWSKPFDVLP